MATLGITDVFYRGEIGAQSENINQGIRLRPRPLRLHPSHKLPVMNHYSLPPVFREPFLLQGVIWVPAT